MNVFDLFIKLSVDDSEVDNGFKRVSNSLGNMKTSIGSVVKAASKIGAVVTTVYAGVWVTMGVPSDGSYGIPEGLVFGFPCVCRGGDYEIIQGIGLDDDSRVRLERTKEELLGELEAVRPILER